MLFIPPRTFAFNWTIRSRWLSGTLGARGAESLFGVAAGKSLERIFFLLFLGAGLLLLLKIRNKMITQHVSTTSMSIIALIISGLTPVWSIWRCVVVWHIYIIALVYIYYRSSQRTCSRAVSSMPLSGETAEWSNALTGYTLYMLNDLCATPCYAKPMPANRISP